MLRHQAVRLLAWLLCAVLVPSRNGAAQQDRGVALINANVVDVDHGVIVPNQTVITRGGRIQAVGSAATPIPSGTRRVDIRGHFVIPGLWDMHVHVTHDSAPADVTVRYFGSMLVRHGVTGVRDAGGDGHVLGSLESTAAGLQLALPRLVFSGEKVGPAAGKPWSEAQATAAIHARLKEGASFIKLRPGRQVEPFRITLAACAAAALPCVTHVPAADTSIWFALRDNGSVEHLFNIAEHVSSVPAATLFALQDEYYGRSVLRRIMYKLRLRERPADPEVQRVAVRDTSQDRAFFDRMAATGMWVTPTLLLHHYLTRYEPDLPAAVDSQWTRRALPVAPRRTAAELEVTRARWSLYPGLVRAMHRSGVAMLAGTDFFPQHVPGAALHAEMIMLQQAGIPASAVLRMATLNPALYFGAQDSLGRVAPGRVADLVVLRRNPLEDVRHVSEIAMVMLRGRLYDRAGLDSLERIGKAGLAELRNQLRP